jgi:ACS family hexuronate transporter-like MFS transporter
MIGLFTSSYVAIALLCVGGFAHQALSGALITLSSDVFGRNEVATANGLTGMAAGQQYPVRSCGRCASRYTWF